MKVFEALSQGESLELRMYGVVGDGWGEDGITAELVSRALRNAPNCKFITVRMSSPGGAAFEGLAIRSILASHPAQVTGIIEGLAASAMSVIAMGCDFVQMHEGSAFMVHEAATVTRGDATEHAKTLAALETLNDGMASVYAARSGMDKKECRKMMTAETWLTPAQAVAKGLVDEVIAAKAPASVPAAFDFSLFGYQHAPTEFTAQATTPAQMETPTMSFARIAVALGLADSADEAAVMAALNALQKRATAAEGPLAELRAMTAANDNSGLLGAVRGFQAAAAQLPQLQQQLAAQQKTAEEQKRAALIAADAADPKGRKLTPALIELLKDKPVAELEAYIAAAPNIPALAPTTAQQQSGTAATSQTSTVATPGIVTHNGKSWEQLTAADKHNLHVDDNATYVSLRANWEARGKPLLPKSTPTPQRVSA